MADFVDTLADELAAAADNGTAIATVTAVPTASTVTVSLRGGSITVPKLASYAPATGEACVVVKVAQGNYIAIGRPGAGTANQGAQGPAGRSVSSATVNSSGVLVLTMSDGTTINAGTVVGPQGVKGDQGLQGYPGTNRLAVYTSTTLPTSAGQGDQILESDTGYVRVNTSATTGSPSWQFVSGPTISARLSGLSPTNLAAGNNTMSFGTRTLVGDITATSASRYTFGRPGWYDFRFNVRLTGTAGERFISIDILNSAGSQYGAIFHSTEQGTIPASLNVGGPFYITGAGDYCQFNIYNGNASSVEAGTFYNFGIASILFIRPIS